MFININNKIINLKNVSNVHILERKKRIIFNMNYSVQIKTNQGVNRYVSDYVYWDAPTEVEMEKNIEFLKNKESFSSMFLSGVDDTVWINIHEVSTVKFVDNKKRVIFNLSHPITYNDKDGIQRITSDFVYVDCGTLDKYKKYVESVVDNLGTSL